MKFALKGNLTASLVAARNFNLTKSSFMSDDMSSASYFENWQRGHQVEYSGNWLEFVCVSVRVGTIDCFPGEAISRLNSGRVTFSSISVSMETAID